LCAGIALLAILLDREIWCKIVRFELQTKGLS